LDLSQQNERRMGAGALGRRAKGTICRLRQPLTEAQFQKLAENVSIDEYMGKAWK
jgi:hypothetical protein